MREGGSGEGRGVIDARRDAILQALWPEGPNSRLGVWAVVDCARDPKIYLALLESRLEFRSLYSGKLPRALEMNAPHLVEMFPDNPLTRRWLDEGWGQSWGIHLRLADPSNLRHHLRKFLKVEDEDGRRLLFRYYDPRVLVTFLRSCDQDQAQTFFGPIHAFVSEHHAGQALARCTLAPSGVQVVEQRLLPAVLDD